MARIRNPSRSIPIRFNLCHILVDPKNHGLLGYREVIESFRWGLTELGHEVTLELNHIVRDRINIIFGFQMLSAEAIAKIAPNSIVYNLEQMVGYKPEQLKANFRAAAQRFQIWDYCPANFDIWGQLQPLHPPICVPVGWAPTLERIPKIPEDIDVLLYGRPSNERFQIIAELCAHGIHCVFACGLYGDSRDSLIARSKIVLNINLFQTARIFEIVRVSYLLANAKAVVSDIYPNSIIEPDLKDALAFAPLDQIRDTCIQLLNNEPARQQLAARAQSLIRQRNILNYLKPALEKIPP